MIDLTGYHTLSNCYVGRGYYETSACCVPADEATAEFTLMKKKSRSQYLIAVRKCCLLFSLLITFAVGSILPIFLFHGVSLMNILNSIIVIYVIKNIIYIYIYVYIYVYIYIYIIYIYIICYVNTINNAEL